MPRSRTKVPAHARHKKILKQAKGFRNRRKNTFRIAHQSVWEAGQYAYVGRKVKKRKFRSLWIQRINAAVRIHDDEMNYSQFINGLTKAGIVSCDQCRLKISKLRIKETLCNLLRLVSHNDCKSNVFTQSTPKISQQQIIT